MKKANYLSIIFYFLYVSTYSQTANWQWAKGAGGVSQDYSNSVTADGNENVIITGNFDSFSITFGTMTLVNSGGSDIFIVKYDNFGNVLWAKNAGGTSNDIASDITTDLNGDILVTGYFMSSTILFGSTTLYNTGDNDMFIVKYDSLGNVKWAKSMVGNSLDKSTNVASDMAGNIFVTGLFASDTLSLSTTNLINIDGQDMFIAKFDLNGNLLWAKNVGGSISSSFLNNVWGNSIETDLSGNVVAAGLFMSQTVTFGSTTLVNNGALDVFLVKYDGFGNVIWAKNFGGNDEESITSCAIDKNGNIVITGYFYSPNISFGNQTLLNFAGRDMFVVKFDSAGNVMWAKSAGGNFDDVGCSVAIDSSSDIFITGNFSSSTLIFDTDSLVKGGAQDLFIAKYDTLGNVLWANNTSSVGGFTYLYSNCITSDNDGNLIITGSFTSTNLTFGTTLLSNQGNSDLFVAKLDDLVNEIQNYHTSNYSVIFPNPAKNSFVIDSKDIRSSSVSIFDITGKLIHSKDILYNTKTEISIEDLLEGVYLVQINHLDFIETKKLIVVK